MLFFVFHTFQYKEKEMCDKIYTPETLEIKLNKKNIHKKSFCEKIGARWNGIFFAFMFIFLLYQNVIKFILKKEKFLC